METPKRIEESFEQDIALANKLDVLQRSLEGRLIPVVQIIIECLEVGKRHLAINKFISDGDKLHSYPSIEKVLYTELLKQELPLWLK